MIHKNWHKNSSFASNKVFIRSLTLCSGMVSKYGNYYIINGFILYCAKKYWPNQERNTIFITSLTFSKGSLNSRKDFLHLFNHMWLAC